MLAGAVDRSRFRRKVAGFPERKKRGRKERARKDHREEDCATISVTEWEKGKKKKKKKKERRGEKVSEDVSCSVHG